MKRTIISIIVITSVILQCKIAKSQDYHTGIGVRLGGVTSGLSVKHFVNSNGALEGILGFGYRSFLITGLYEYHLDIANAPGLRWFYGGGAHIGFFRYGGYYYAYRHGHYIYYVDEPGMTSVVGGLDFILGLEYKFRGAPLTVGLDLKPFVDFYDGVNGYWDGAFSFRFAF
jgi:hypothetical protein